MTILSNGHQWKYSEFLDNKNYSFDKKQIFLLEQFKNLADKLNKTSFVKNVIKKSSLLSLSSILTNIEINSSFESLFNFLAMLLFLIVCVCR